MEFGAQRRKQKMISRRRRADRQGRARTSGRRAASPPWSPRPAPSSAQPLEEEIAEALEPGQGHPDVDDLRQFVAASARCSRSARRPGCSWPSACWTRTTRQPAGSRAAPDLLRRPRTSRKSPPGPSRPWPGCYPARTCWTTPITTTGARPGLRRSVQVRDGKTGADFFNDMATDKRFLPYLDEPPGPAPAAG